jgi:hypothetical protein
MADIKNEQITSEAGPEFEQISELFDVYAQTSSVSVDAKAGERWSPLKTIIFLLAVSLILWALIIVLVYHLFWP